MKRDSVIPKLIKLLDGKDAEELLNQIRGLLSEVPNDKEWKQYQKIANKARKKYGNNTDIELRITHTGIGTAFSVWIKEDNQVISITDFDSW